MERDGIRTMEIPDSKAEKPAFFRRIIATGLMAWIGCGAGIVFGQITDPYAIETPPALVDGKMEPQPPLTIQLPSTRLEASGEGTSFSIAAVGESTITLASDRAVRASMVSLSGTIILTVEGLDSFPTAALALSGLQGNTTYFLSQDGIFISSICADAGGFLAFQQDISSPHNLLIMDKHGTITIFPDGSVSDPTAFQIDAASTTYTLLKDVTETQGNAINIQRGNITLDGNGHILNGDGKGYYGIIAATNWRGPKIRNFRITGFRGGGILLVGQWFSGILNSTFTFNQVAIYLNNTKQTTVDSNTIQTSTEAEVVPYATEGTVISNNIIGPASPFVTSGYNGTKGVWDYGPYWSSDMRIVNNAFTDESIAILLDATLRAEISSNTFTTTRDFSLRVSPYFGIMVLARGAPGTMPGGLIDRQDIVANNSFRWQEGLQNMFAIIIDAPGNTIKSNSIGFVGVGVEVQNTRRFPSATSPNVITNNTLNIPSDGIRVLSGRGESVSQNDIISGNSAVVVNSNQCRTSSNTIRSAGRNGIEISGSGNEVSGNSIANSRIAGLSIFTDGSTFFENNISSGGAGIFVPTFSRDFPSAGSNNSIFHNNFAGNAASVKFGAKPYPSWPDTVNAWSRPWPGGGNFYSDYSSSDDLFGAAQSGEGSDGIADIPRAFNSLNMDNFPFLSPDRWKEPDRIPPGKITDLRIESFTSSTSVKLAWTHTGDDGSSGTLTGGYYDIRFATFPITNNAIFAATPYSQKKFPLFGGWAAGISLDARLSELASNTTYFFALRLHDDADNVSFVSNQTAPMSPSLSGDGIVSLVSNAGSNITLVSTTTADVSLALATAAAQGLKLVSGIYEITPHAVFTPPAILTFNFDPSVIADTTTLAVFRFNGVTWSSSPATGITGQNIQGSAVTANISHASLWGLFVAEETDVLPPRTAINIGRPAFGAEPVFITSGTPVSFAAADDARTVGDGKGAGAARTVYGIDSPPDTIFSGPFAIPAEGPHTISFFSVDSAGNAEIPHVSTVAVDNTPPQTSLIVDGSTAAAGAVTMSAAGFLGFKANDPLVNNAASGVKVTEFSVDSDTFSVYAGTFSLTVGAHTVSFLSIDNLGNRENVKNAAVTVLPPLVVSLDLAPDTLNLKSQGQYVTAFLEVIGIKSAADIDASTLKIAEVNNQPLPVPIGVVQENAGKSGKLKFGTIGDSDLDGIADLAVKFDRQALIAGLPVGEQVNITLKGGFKDGQTFSADDFIRTIIPGNVAAHSGGKVSHPAGASAEIPSGALLSDSDIVILRISGAPEEEEQRRGREAAQKGFDRIGKPFEFGPEGISFASSVTLSLPYEEAKLGEKSEDTLQVACWNPDSRVWEALASVVNKANKTVSAQTMHFSMCQVLSRVILPAKPDEKITRLKVAFSGGKVERGDNVKVEIPEGALNRELEISIEPENNRSPEEENRKREKVEEKKLAAVSAGVEYGPEGTIFEKPVTVTLAYDVGSLPAGVREDELKIHYWNPKTMDWEAMYSIVDKSSHTVSAATSHFSLYRILGPFSQPQAAVPAADPGFTLRDVYVFPNPAKRGANPTVHIEAGQADRVDIRIYDISGELITTAALVGAPKLIDDGSGRGPQYAYEWIWDVSNAGSGIYICVIEAHKNGSGGLKTIKKIGIIK